MEVPYDIKNEIVQCQHALRTAIGYYQICLTKFKQEPRSLELRNRLKSAETAISIAGAKQKPVITRLRRELDYYQQRRLSNSQLVDYDADNEYIAKQIRQHRRLSKHKPEYVSKWKQRQERRREKRRREAELLQLSKESKLLDGKEKKDGSVSPGKNDKNEPSGAPKSQILLNRRSNLLNALNKIYEQNTITITTVAPEPAQVTTPAQSSTDDVLEKAPASPPALRLSPIRESTSPIPVHKEVVPEPVVVAKSPDLPEQLEQPILGDVTPDSQEYFMRYFGLITHDECTTVQAQRSERKKRCVTSTAKTDFLYGNFDVTPRKKRQYLQQHSSVTTRTELNRPPVVQSPTSVSVIDLKIPQEPVVQPLGPSDTCNVCQLNDTVGALSTCVICRGAYHSSCHGWGPGTSKQVPLCPPCARRSPSPVYDIKDKIADKQFLIERNESLKDKLRLLDVRAAEVKNKVEQQDSDRDKLMSEQEDIQKKVRLLLEFVGKFKGQFGKEHS